MLICIVALHMDYLYPFGLKPASFGLVYKPLLTMIFLQVQNHAFICLCHLTSFIHGKNIPLSVDDQFCHLALSIGIFQPQELEHMFLYTCSFQCTIGIIFFFFGL